MSGRVSAKPTITNTIQSDICTAQQSMQWIHCLGLSLDLVFKTLVMFSRTLNWINNVQAFAPFAWWVIECACVVKMIYELCSFNWHRWTSDWLVCTVFGGGGVGRGVTRMQVGYPRIHQPLKWTLNGVSHNVSYICTPKWRETCKNNPKYGVFKLLWCWDRCIP